MALSADTRPHFTTIANFISSMDGVIAPLFRDVLTVCYTEGLIGRRGKPVKSNITDNESAKLVSSHGVIHGYNGIATVDADHQIVVDAQAFGDVHEAAHVQELIESVETTFCFIDPEKKPFESVVVTADSGFSSEEAVLDAEIDGYIADPQFRKRDPRFADQQKHKAKTTDRKQTSKARKYFTTREFTFNDEGESSSARQESR